MAAEDKLRDVVRTREEAAMQLAFEEAHRLLDRIDGLKDSVPASLDGVTAKFVAEAQADRAAIQEYAAAVRQDLTDSGESLKAAAESLKAGLLSAAEKIGASTADTRATIEKLAEIAGRHVQQTGERTIALARDEATRIAHDEASRVFVEVSKAKMLELEKAVNDAVHRLGTVGEQYGGMVEDTDKLVRRIATHQVSAPRGSWLHTFAGAAIAAVIILGGQVLLSNQSLAQLSAQVSYLFQKANGGQSTQNAVNADAGAWGAALIEEWKTLPADAQRRIQAAHERLTH